MGRNANNPPPKNDRSKTVVSMLIILLSFISLLAFFSNLFLERNWDGLTLEEIIFQLRASLAGTDTVLVERFLTRYLPLVYLGTAVFVGLLIASSRTKNGLYARHTRIAVIAFSFLLLFGSVVRFVTKTDLLYALSSGQTDFIEEQYVDPSVTHLSFPAKKRNLIYIFLESMEGTYADQESGGAFTQNMIPELTELAVTNECFSGSRDQINGAIPLYGTTWTMGGMFAQTSGLPLKIPFSGNDMEFQDYFFSGITTLGDILSKEGYALELLLGSDATFGGRRLYYEEHGNYEIKDLLTFKDASSVPESNAIAWGHNDELLFERAKYELLSLANHKQPFCFITLTLDTHFPDGFPCELCRADFDDNQYANCIACSSRQVTDFVNWIQRQDFYDNTTIVLCGDHTTMQPGFCDGIGQDYTRKTYTAIINSATSTIKHDGTNTTPRYYSTFDLFPTTLASIGVEIEGDRLGLGVNLYSDTRTLVESYGVASLNRMLARRSHFMDSLVGEDFSENDLERTRAEASIRIITNDRGEIRLETGPLTHINPRQIDDMEFVLRDLKTGWSDTYRVLPSYDHNDPNAFVYCSVDTKYAPQLQANMSAGLYISVGDFKHEPIASVEWEVGN